MNAWSSGVRLRALLATVLLLSASALAVVTKPTKHLADLRPKVDLEQVFPESFNGWKQDPNLPVTIVSPDQAALIKLLYAQLVTRTYIGPNGERIMLSVAYGGDQTDATRAHRPDVCYPVQGFQIASNEDATLSVGNGELPVRHMFAKLGQRHEPVTFWFVVGEHVAVSGPQQKYAQLRYGFRGLIADGLLMRVSSIDQDPEAGYRLQTRFINDLYAAMKPEHRSLAFGSAVSAR
ncbi:MAG: EpsI family protein [Burkholderiales bacterium]|uniref:exosortase-associated protein EpsI, B-type n=1 Tax=Roseateles sp. TaxID=1971397 RepID=UPI000FADAE26|nr:MAG: EpsI family protein [Burkholderiales bacterium]